MTVIILESLKEKFYYFAVFRRITLFVSILFLSTSLQLLPVSAVENGIDATNDFNVVAIDAGESGFLYAPRIVLTVAHELEGNPSKDRVRLVGYPGQLSQLNKYPIMLKTIKTKKIFYAPNFQPRTQTNWFRNDDFAVIVLESPMPMKNKVRIATQEDIQRYIKNKTPVRMVGYGRQKDRKTPDQQGIVDIYPNELVSRLLSDQESNVIKRGLPPGVSFTSDLNFEQKPGQGSTCDGDSGAGWFVEEDGYRNYLGPQSSGWGMPNCGYTGVWDFNGSMVGISAAYKFMDLIAEAEKYVADNPYIEPKSKTAGFNNKITITCVKGKTTKKVSGITPKCPVGYKKK